MDIDESPSQALLRACACAEPNDEDSIKVLLCQAGADGLRAVDAEGRSPLLIACSSGGLSAVQMLLEARADSESVDLGGRGLCLLAAESGSRELLAWLLGQGLVNLTECAEDGSTALLCAAGGQHAEQSAQMVAFLLDGPPGAQTASSLEERDERGADALLCAAEAGAPAVVKELLRRGASVATVDAHGCGLLHFAAAGGSLAMVEFCVKDLKFACDVRDGDGDTPLLIAAYEGNCEVVEWLLRNGSSLEERNADGMSAAMSAAAGEQSEVLALLSRLSGESAESLWVKELDRHPELVLNFLEKGAAEM
ncbi:unnamed protein product [Polarella glacialis]|uniref:Uncharacterized protein n=1 Tax=Polarella glacialis TaxID=89957 RepID=A0A813EJJ0_POLGL|nr:unnamed protein product [Polarella glacialis]